MNMLVVTLVLFVLAAVLGLVVALQIFKKRPTSKGVALSHGVVAAAGLIVLILHAAKNPTKLLTTAIVLLVVAALGGAVVFVNDLKGKAGPAGLVVVHVLVALTAVALVLVVAIQ
jgi:uncharacterized membrane protein